MPVTRSTLLLLRHGIILSAAIQKTEDFLRGLLLDEARSRHAEDLFDILHDGFRVLSPHMGGKKTAVLHVLRERYPVPRQSAKGQAGAGPWPGRPKPGEERWV